MNVFRLQARLASRTTGRRYPSTIVFPLAGRRFASTETAGAVAASATTTTTSATTATATASEAVVNVVADPVAFQVVADASAHIGYLESIGIAQSWVWPSDIAAHILESVHVYAGLPWWGTIAVVGVASRLVTAPLMMKGFEMRSKMALIQSQLDRLKERLNSGLPSEVTQARKLQKALYAKHGIKMRYLGLPLLNIPIAYGMFVAIRKLADKPIAGMVDQGALWFQDLSAIDPYMGLPLISGATFFIGTFLGAEGGAPSSSSSMQRKIMLGLPPIMFTVMGLFYSSANLLFFASTGAVAAAQGLFMNTRLFRKLIGISEQAHRAAVATKKAKADTSITQLFKDTYKEAEKRTEIWERSRNPSQSAKKSATIVTPQRVTRK
ncbi:60Kd inner membrane protein-domain-containing protein [Lipomyces japonicus]|uniref:60Kd inner membrane protein-domain-containing protein n=1 Tax=Lipomyces japonicus TaxID=56871 RepID=UPI0034CD27D6